MPSIADRNPSAAASAVPQTTVYYLVWRVSPSQPWRSEEFFNRIDAHNRYFALLQRGVEAYLERRQSAVLTA